MVLTFSPLTRASDFKIGDIVEHSSVPDWGPARIIHIEQGYIDIRFLKQTPGLPLEHIYTRQSPMYFKHAYISKFGNKFTKETV